MEGARSLRPATLLAGPCPEEAAAPGELQPSAVQNRAQEQMDEASRCLLDSAGDGIYGIDAEGLTTFANPAAEVMTGWQRGELIGKPQHKTIHHSHADGSHYPTELCPIYMAVKDGRVHRSDQEVFWRKDGTSFAVSYTSTPIMREGRPDGAVILFQDISRRKRREAWEKMKNDIFLAITCHQELLETLSMIARACVNLYTECGVVFMIRYGSELRLAAGAGVSAGLRKSLGMVKTTDRTLACARACELGMEIMTSVAEERAVQGFPGCLALPLLSATGDVLGVCAFYGEPDELIQIQATVSAHGVCDLARIAIEHQSLHLELLRQSQHDHLTGLPNRLLLEDRLDRAIMHAKRHGTHVAVCYLDLDLFKQINDTLGHSTGDEVLRHVALILKRNLKEIDTVARQGGDEFILILSDLKTEKEADRICERILKGLREPVAIGKHTITTTGSLGRSMYPADGADASILLQNADFALSNAKCSGRDRMQPFNAMLGERIQRDIELQRELRFAIDRDQLRVVYQPLYSTARVLIGFEALLRWSHPVLGDVEPGQFIPLAEKTGLILSIGEWVMEEACRRARAWNIDSSVPLKMFVNVSGVQLGQEDFCETVARVLAVTGLDAKRLELEITETSIVADIKAASARLKRVRELGIRISIDDFGCGHSTFSYLHQLPIDTIKIDRSFIACLDGTEKKSAIIRTIVALAKELGLETVAEGVETGLQLDEIQGTQCGLVQGYLLSRPLSPEDARLLIQMSPG